MTLSPVSPRTIAAEASRLHLWVIVRRQEGDHACEIVEPVLVPLPGRADRFELPDWRTKSNLKVEADQTVCRYSLGFESLHLSRVPCSNKRPFGGRIVRPLS